MATVQVQRRRGDKRYTVRPEFCGYPTARFVARFLGVWIGVKDTAAEAHALADEHNAARFSPLN